MKRDRSYLEYNWQVGQEVILCMAPMPLWEEFHNCYLKATIECVYLTTVGVLIKGLEKRGPEIVAMKRLRSLLPEKGDVDRVWKKHERVCVYCKCGKVPTWWLATICSIARGGNWKIRWSGEYKNCSKTVTVSADTIFKDRPRFII